MKKTQNIELGNDSAKLQKVPDAMWGIIIGIKIEMVKNLALPKTGNLALYFWRLDPDPT